MASQVSDIKKIDDLTMSRKQLLLANIEVALASASKQTKSNKKQKTTHTEI